MMKLEDIKSLIVGKYYTVGNEQAEFTNFAPYDKAYADSMTFITGKKEGKFTDASVIITEEDYDYFPVNDNDGNPITLIIYNENAKLSFMRIVAAVASRELKAEIDKSAFIGIGTVIGADGFGYVKNEHNELERFPHIGHVRIGKNVEIGCNTCIDRGSIGDTVIGDGVKIDNLVHVAHNVEIGDNTAIVAGAVIGGSAKIGKRCFIGMNASIKNGIRIGNDVTVGAGSVVIKDIPDGETWAGVPAKKIR